MGRNFYRFATVLLIIVMLLTGCGVDPNTEEGATIGEIVEDVEKPQDETDRPSKEEEPEKQPNQEDPLEEQTPEEEKPSEEPEKEPEKPGTEKPVQKPTQKPTEDEETPEQNEPEQPEEEQPKEEPEEPEEEPEEESEEEPEEEEPEEEEPEEEEPEEDEEEDEESPTVPSTPGVTVKPQTPAAPTPKSVKIASYNIKALMHGEDTAGIIQELKEVNADIVGLQEVDKNTNRSKVDGKKVHQVEMLAKELGYPYWSFDKLIDYSGGEYGMAILSRYPIISSDVVQYEAQESNDSHVRKYGRHVLRLGSKDLAFYNTHLCVRDDTDTEKDPISKLQLKEVTDRMKKDVYSVLTGDLNMPAQTAASVVAQNSMLTLLNDGGPGTGKIGNEKASKYIDHIIVSKMMSYPINNSGTGIEVNETPYSDHNLIYTYVSFK